MTDGRWIRRFTSGGTAAVRLFCFHFAGGSPAMFRNWPPHLSAGISVEAILLPGRDSRFKEPAYDQMGPLVEALVEVLRGRLDRPYALFGHSMGAQVSYNVAHALSALELPPPVGLFVAASPGPSLHREIPGWNESDERLVGYLRDLGGTQANVLGNSDLLNLMLPTLRADLTVVATWPYQARTPLTVPIHAFTGEDDKFAPAESMAWWSRETVGRFRQTMLPGGHFFVHTALADVTASISRDLLEDVRAQAC
jgi:surfactin synthase thioesterase subunit